MPCLRDWKVFRRDTVDVQNLSINTGLIGNLPSRCCISDGVFDCQLEALNYVGTGRFM